jgi:hypothetical protein
MGEEMHVECIHLYLLPGTTRRSHSIHPFKVIMYVHDPYTYGRLGYEKPAHASFHTGYVQREAPLASHDRS